MRGRDNHRTAAAIAAEVSQRLELALEEAVSHAIDPDDVEAAEFMTACLVGDRRLAAILAPRIFKGEALHRVEIAHSIGGAA